MRDNAKRGRKSQEGFNSSNPLEKESLGGREGREGYEEHSTGFEGEGERDLKEGKEQEGVEGGRGKVKTSPEGQQLLQQVGVGVGVGVRVGVGVNVGTLMCW